jgi:hypothetical protein
LARVMPKTKMTSKGRPNHETILRMAMIHVELRGARASASKGQSRYFGRPG